MRSKKLTDSAKNESCIRCGRDVEGEVCARHYNGIRQHAFGKGRGEKCSDLASAELCMNCDAMFAEGAGLQGGCHFGGWRTVEDRSEEFLFWCMMTNIRRAERGDLKG